MTTAEEHWHQWRSEGIGASDVAASWTGKYGGAHRAVAKRLGLVGDDIDPDLADRGHRWEQPIADAIAALTGLYVVGEQAWCEQDGSTHRRATVDGFLSQTPDATIETVDALIEEKTVTEGARPSWDYYETQVQAQMLVTGVPRALLAVAVIGGDDEIVRLTCSWVEADPDMQEMLAAEYDRLWAYVQAGELPEPDCPSAAESVKEATANSDPDAETVDLGSIAEAIEEFGRIKAAEKAAGDRRKELEAVIKHHMGAATRGVCDGWRVSYSNPAKVLTADAQEAILLTHPNLGKTVLDVDRAKTELDDLNEWKEAAGARRLTIKETT